MNKSALPPEFFHHVQNQFNLHHIEGLISQEALRNCLKDDLAVGISGLREDLKALAYHAKIGDYYNRSERIAHLAGLLAPQFDVYVSQAKRVSQIADVDLVSRLVEEIPIARGLGAALYAEAFNEPHEIVAALYDLYHERTGKILTDKLAMCYRVAECLDTLVAFEVVREANEVFARNSLHARSSRFLVSVLLKTQTSVDIFVRASLEAKDIPGGPGVCETTSGLLLDHLMFEQRDFHGVGDLPLDILSERALTVTRAVFTTIQDELIRQLSQEGLTRGHILAIAQTGTTDLAKIAERAAALKSFLETPAGQTTLEVFQAGIDLNKLEPEMTPEHLMVKITAADLRIKAAIDQDDFPQTLNLIASLADAMSRYRCEKKQDPVEKLSALNPHSQVLQTSLRQAVVWDFL